MPCRLTVTAATEQCHEQLLRHGASRVLLLLCVDDAATAAVREDSVGAISNLIVNGTRGLPRCALEAHCRLLCLLCVCTYIIVCMSV